MKGRGVLRPGLTLVWISRVGPGALMMALAAGAAAQVQRTEISVQSTLMATDNGNDGAEGFKRSDMLLSVHPRLAYRRQGTGLRVNASVDAEFVGSAKDTRDGRILPGAHVDASAVVVDRLLSIEGGLDVRQTAEDPFGSGARSGSTLNTRTSGTFRLSPILQYEPTARTSVLARYDIARTNVVDTADGDVATDAGVVRVSIKPQPLGLAFEWGGDRTDYADNRLESSLRSERLNAIASVALSGEWVLGLSAGREHSEFAGVEETDAICGLRLYWVPGPRTELAASLDRRFFGTGWNVAARHRTPRMSFALRTLREPATASNGSVGGSGLASFLDAILTTRNPDSAQRGGMVNDLIASRGLQTTIQGASGSTAEYAQLRTATEATWMYLGSRTTFSVSAYGQELRQLTRQDGATGTPAPATDDNRQRGATVGVNYRLEPLLSFDLSADWSQIDGLALRSGERTREAALTASLVRNLTPKTNASAGVRLRRISTNASNVNSFDESAVFIGLGHRF